MFERFLGAPGRTGCLDHLADALAPYGIGRDAIEAPLDLFMRTEVTADGGLLIHAQPFASG